MRLRVGALLLVACSAIILSACGATGARATQSTSTTLTAAEIATVNLPTLYDVIQRLRPRWLRARAGGNLRRAPTIVVYQGQVNLGDLNALRSVGPETIESVEFIDAATASATLPGLGSRHVDGAILLKVKVGT